MSCYLSAHKLTMDWAGRVGSYSSPNNTLPNWMVNRNILYPEKIVARDRAGPLLPLGKLSTAAQHQSAQ